MNPITAILNNTSKTSLAGGVGGLAFYLVLSGGELPCLPFLEDCTWGQVWRDWIKVIATASLVYLGHYAADSANADKGKTQ